MKRRVFIITGAASGIGRATALAIAGPQTAMVLHSGKNQAGLDSVAKSASAIGTDVVSVTGDICKADTVQNCVTKALETFGTIDAIIGVAGRARNGDILTLSRQDFYEACDESLWVLIEFARQARAELKASAAPRLIAVSSFVAHLAKAKTYDPFAATALSRAALENAVRQLSQILAVDGILVNAVVPGLIEKDDAANSRLSTQMIGNIQKDIPLQRRGTAEEVAQVLAFLASEKSSYITGQIWHVNGGLIKGCS
ncbi:SDR family NAD(P)-dependent oxidoreductase [Bartonella sp. LJL80]